MSARIISSILGSAAAFIAGIAMPVAFPQAPQWIGQLGLCVSAVSALMALGFWLWDHRNKSKLALPAISSEPDYLRGELAKRKAVAFADAIYGQRKPTATDHFFDEVNRAVRRVGPAHLGLEEAKREFWTRKREPIRNATLSEGLAFAALGEWGKTFYDAVIAGLVPSNEPLIQFRQLAHDGTLSAWGKRSENGIFQLIPNEHWVDHNVEWFDLMRGTARTENVTHTTPDPFLEIMVSRVQFEKEWPNVG